RQIALEGSFGSSLEGLLGALFVSSPAVIQYIGKIVLPFNLSVFPIMRDTTFIYGFIVLALVSFAIWRSRQKRLSFITFGLLWFGFFLAPSFVRISAGLVHDFQEHRMYLPMIGMLVVFGEVDFFKNMDKKKTSIIACGLALLIFAAINLRHAENFRNRLAYWENSAATAPHSWLTHLKLGYMYYEAGLLDKAEAEYQKAVKLERIQPASYAGLGHVFLARNELEKAEFEFRRAIAACDANYPSYVSLGTVYYRQGRLKEAAQMWIKAIKLKPDEVTALRNLAIFCAEQRDFKAAHFYVDRLRQLGVEPPAEFLKAIGDIGLEERGKP
ncbi:MAG: tetratricopeptide repeat protein, partial [Candidatus Omnitrophica bacterium]|nr:tetratricopeptide repeat protein [Candidatus Omnitrophota bacterium]